jgi:hypothetical protein
MGMDDLMRYILQSEFLEQMGNSRMLEKMEE